MFRNFTNLFCLSVLLCLAAGAASSVHGQHDRRPPKDPPATERPPKPGSPPPGFLNRDGVTTERSMMVDPTVAIKLCVAEGNLRINGWQRNEVRVFVKNGRRFELKDQVRSPESGKVSWLWVVNKSTTPRASDCIAGDRIEIDAPYGASFSLEGRSALTSVDSVKKVKARFLAGTISLRNVSGGIDAATSQGDLMVDNSAGAIGLETTTGNIVATDVKPGQIGELLRTKTQSGTITLQRVEHRNIESISISGALLFDGKFLTGGIYKFRTNDGEIRFSIPAASSCTFKMTYGQGSFKSDIPLKVVTVDESPRVKTVVATIGAGEAAVSVITSSGSIAIRKAGAATP